ncbi:MAG: polysaccharide biosynthesis/export family protein [Elusimicrobiota bacterium]|nr:polysaccharide biosynthesis/export family protein [Endomicrobiia bacterium]MDW8165890.1 polysaccharide biosynthesis/export family protein [Elusimicrobiota bacterium]
MEQFAGFNPDYLISIGDKITIHIWGPINYRETLTVDPQGNIFIPNVGPVKVLGVRNGDLNQVVEREVKKVFKEHTGIYATLETSVPVKVFVTGFVRNPGLYGGLSSNSILYFIDRAGGIDPARGSFIDIKVFRNNKLRWKYNLYDFLINGTIHYIQMADGDVILVEPKKSVFKVSGEVYNPFQFEFEGESIKLEEVFKLAKLKPGATHVAISRKKGIERITEYYSIEEAWPIEVYNGDEVSVLSDRYPGTIYVRLEGAHSGPRALILPYGAKLKDALAKLVPNEKSNLSAVQLFRKSVAQRQKEAILQSLRQLQTYAFTGRAETKEEVELRAKEAELISRFIETAKNVEPKGQVILESINEAQEMLLEDGDVIYVPEKTSVVMVHGEVRFPNAVLFKPGAQLSYYISQAGDFTQRASKQDILIVRQNGKFEISEKVDIKPGDEIFVLPKIEAKRLEIVRGITQILYQIAVSARVLLMAW